MLFLVRGSSAIQHDVDATGMRLLRRMKKPNYVEPAVGWNGEDEKSGVIKYGVANYEPLTLAANKKITPSMRPPLPAPAPGCISG